MPKDSWDMAQNVGVNYLEYMTWTDWIHNLNRYKLLIKYLKKTTVLKLI